MMIQGRKHLFIFIIIIIFFVLPSISLAQDNLVINEVYYDTIGTDSKEEFVELYNPTDKDINLTDYYLKDNSKNSKYVFSEVFLAAKGYLVLARDKAGFKNLFGFEPDLNDFNISLNNGGDYLELYQPNNGLVDRISWELGDGSHEGVSTGESLERSVDSNELVISSPPTPGLGLFRSPVIDEIDIEANQVEVSCSWPASNKQNFERMEVYLNDGLARTFYNFADHFILEDLEFGQEYHLYIKLVKSNNGREISARSNTDIFNTQYDYSDQVLINEVLPNPNDNHEEFIELTNLSDRVVNLKGWQIADKVKTFKFIKNAFISPGGYLVIYKSETGISLNNSGDKVSLIYPDGEITDFTNYRKIDKNISWARNDEKFRLTDTPTPGKKNIFNKNDQIDESGIKKVKIEQIFKIKDGSRVKVIGKISTPIGRLGKQIIYIQDSSAGVQIYNHFAHWPKLGLGDKVSIVGEVSTSRGEKRLKINKRSDIKFLNNSKIDPAPLNWKTINKFVGRLIKVKANVSSSSGNTFYITSGTKEIKVYIKESTKIDKPKTRKGYRARIIGVLIKSDSGYKILPRLNSDLKIDPVFDQAVTNLDNGLEPSYEIGLAGSKSRVGSALKLINFDRPNDYRKLTDQSNLVVNFWSLPMILTIISGVLLLIYLGYLYRKYLLELIAI
jgi:hypothetical protein